MPACWTPCMFIVIIHIQILYNRMSRPNFQWWCLSGQFDWLLNPSISWPTVVEIPPLTVRKDVLYCTSLCDLGMNNNLGFWGEGRTQPSQMKRETLLRIDWWALLQGEIVVICPLWCCIDNLIKSATKATSVPYQIQDGLAPVLWVLRNLEDWLINIGK